MYSPDVSEYRSPAIVRGYFRRLGNLHLHVDAGADHAFLLDILKEMEPRSPGKITVIGASVAGPQRRQLPEVYESHTPGAQEEEDFECFLSMALRTRDDVIASVRQVIGRLSSHPGAVLEVETVVGRIEDGRDWESIPLPTIEPIRADDVGFEPAPTKPLELHHGIDFGVTAPLVSLDRVQRLGQEAGVNVGGWYSFVRREGPSFRSNSFHDTEGIQQTAETEHRRLRESLTNFGYPFSLWSTAERVLGIWKAPFRLELIGNSALVIRPRNSGLMN